MDRHVFMEVIVLLALCAGCENPGIDEGAATLVLLGTHPADGAENVPITGPILMAFNEPIDPASVGEAFSLVDESGHAIAGALAVDGKEVRFAPELPLSLAARYHAAVTREVSGSNGASFAAVAAWSFSTTGGRLGPAQRIGTIEGHHGAFQMSVAIDDQARSWAVWLEDVATYSAQVIVPQPQAIVVAAQSTDRSSWQRSARFAAGAAEVALSTACLIWDPQHNGYLVWQEREAAEDRLQLARFDAATDRWGAPEPVTRAPGAGLSYPRCALDPRVGLLVVWLEVVPGLPAKNVIRQRIFDVAQGRWQEPASLLDGGADDAILALLGLQRSGLTTRLYFATEALSTIFLWDATLEQGAVRDARRVAELSPAVEDLQISTNRNGACFLAWLDTHDASAASLRALSRPSGADSWSSPHVVARRPPASQLGELQLSTDTDTRRLARSRGPDHPRQAAPAR